MPPRLYLWHYTHVETPGSFCSLRTAFSNTMATFHPLQIWPWEMEMQLHINSWTPGNLLVSDWWKLLSSKTLEISNIFCFQFSQVCMIKCGGGAKLPASPSYCRASVVSKELPALAFQLLRLRVTVSMRGWAQNCCNFLGLQWEIF